MQAKKSVVSVVNVIPVFFISVFFILTLFGVISEPKPLFAQHAESVPNPYPSKKVADFKENGMRGVDKIVFAARNMGVDGHWYANFGYYAENENRLPYKNGGQLCVYDLEKDELAVLIDDPNGSVRDPQVHYDAEKILFSYRPGGTRYFNLYEINVDGSNLRQITYGEFDDFEPTYLPNDDIVFVSSRCKRWVQCWLTQVAVLHRCGPNGENIHEISSNVEQDNTPWVLHNGQLLYTRWEYVDRSQVDFHHLWTAAPDGTRQMVYYGNMRPSIVMIGAKPIPGSDKIIAAFSPGHGQDEHAGPIAIVDSRLGPDAPESVQFISNNYQHRDPWAFSDKEFMVALDSRIMLLNDQGVEETIFQLPDNIRSRGLVVHEPRPIQKRKREPLIADLTDPEQITGNLSLINVYHGRNMEGIPHGSIKKLLVLETLPKPINFTGGMEPMSYGGSFTLERILGTVPVEEDGSAYFELPALRAFFFVALDENDNSVKRMQSFTSVMPGESTTCLGCHENRTLTPAPRTELTAAMRKSPSKVKPIEGFPDVVDYPRDIQPIWDKNCVACHSNENRSGGVNLCGDRTPMYSISYYTITAKSLVADGRNRPVSNYAPYQLGTGGSKLLKYLDKEHYDVGISEQEKQLVKLWIDTGATYLGTYAGLGCGMIGGYAQNSLDRSDLNWAEMQKAIEVMNNKCVSCHTNEKQLPLSPSDEIGGPPWEPLQPNDVRRKFSRQLVYNLSNPDKSLLLLAPLAKESGGFESCGRVVFKNTEDSDYKTLLSAIERTKKQLDEIKRFDMPGFQPRPQYIREMKRFGILPENADLNEPVNAYELDRKYWESLWYTKTE